MNRERDNRVLETARTAFENYRRGWTSRDFADYLAMLTDEFNFSFPTGKHRGVCTGAEGREKMFAKCEDDAAGEANLTLGEPHTTAIDANTVIFEFESDGTIGDLKYHGRNIIVLEIDGEKVGGFREYFGDLDPKLFGGE